MSTPRTRTGDRKYVEELGEVLRRGEAAELRVFLERNAAHYGDQRQVDQVRAKSEEELVELMHRMVLARRDLADLHDRSRRWLEALEQAR